MKVLSFDIGINNLSFCLVEFNSEYDHENGSDEVNKYIIHDWDVININPEKIKKPNIYYLTKNIISIFDAKTEFLNCSKVVIENQPCMKNPIMKSIQMVIYSYFYIRGINDKKTISEIILMSASNKLKVYDGPPIELNLKSKYTRNKKLAILHTRYILNNHHDYLTFFDNHNKKDDLSDAFLQGIYYLNKHHK